MVIEVYAYVYIPVLIDVPPDKSSSDFDSIPIKMFIPIYQVEIRWMDILFGIERTLIEVEK